MDITIVTSLYRSDVFLSRYLRQSSKTVHYLSNKGINAEILIVSNDATEKEIILLNKTNDEKVRVLFVERESLYSSWNRGVKEARSEIIAFWNVDDIRFPKALYKGYRLLIQDPGIAYFSFYIAGLTRYQVFRKRLTLPFLRLGFSKAAKYNRTKFRNGCMIGPFFMFHMDVYRKIGSFDESMTVAGDFDWTARAASMGIRFHPVSFPGGIFITHFGNISTKHSLIQGEENRIVKERYS